MAKARPNVPCAIKDLMLRSVNARTTGILCLNIQEEKKSKQATNGRRTKSSKNECG